MAWCYRSPCTPNQLLKTVCGFAFGAMMFAVGAHLSYKNVAPQQARTKARSDFVREYLRKKYGYNKVSPDHKSLLFPSYLSLGTHASVSRLNDRGPFDS